MKRNLCLVATVLMLLLSFMAISSGTAQVGTWLTYREDISIASGYADIDSTFTYNGIVNASAINLTLPCAISALSQSDTNFTFYNTGEFNSTYNLTVNGIAVNNSDWTNATVENVTTLAHMVSAGVTNTDTWLTFSFDCNLTSTLIGINITGTDVAFSTTWLTVITIKEKDVTVLPSVGKTSTTSVHTVNNSVNISSTTLWFPLTTAVFNVTYPSHKISQPETTYEFATINNNGSLQNYTQYQKYGPYIYNVEEEIDGSSHEVTIKIKSNEVLTNCVQWVIDPDDDVYDDVFDDIYAPNLEIELNNADFDDWDEDGDNIELTDFTCTDGVGNKFVFIWTEPSAPDTPAAEETIWDHINNFFFGTTSGVPNLVWILVVLIFLVILLKVYVPKKKKK